MNCQESQVDRSTRSIWQTIEGDGFESIPATWDVRDDINVLRRAFDLPDLEWGKA